MSPVFIVFVVPAGSLTVKLSVVVFRPDPPDSSALEQLIVEYEPVDMPSLGVTVIVTVGPAVSIRTSERVIFCLLVAGSASSNVKLYIPDANVDKLMAICVLLVAFNVWFLTSFTNRVALRTLVWLNIFSLTVNSISGVTSFVFVSFNLLSMVAFGAVVSTVRLNRVMFCLLPAGSASSNVRLYGNPVSPRADKLTVTWVLLVVLAIDPLKTAFM